MRNCFETTWGFPLKLDSPRQRNTYRYLHPYIKDGRLIIGYCKTKKALSSLPRIFVSSEKETPLWFTDYPVSPLLENPLPQQIYRAIITKEHAALVNDIVHTTVVYEGSIFEEATPIKMWDIKPLSPRQMSIYFESIKGKHIESLSIKDAYCCLHQDTLVEFLKEIKNCALEIKTLHIISRESHKNSEQYKDPFTVKDEMKDKIGKAFSNIKVDVTIVPFYRKALVHDRSIEFEVIENDATKSKYIYDLTSGIDYLMDQKYAMKIFCYKASD